MTGPIRDASVPDVSAEPPWLQEIRAQGRAGEIYVKLHGLMAALGALFLIVVVSERIAPAESNAAHLLRIIGYIIWALFGLEFLARLSLAPNKRRFLRRNWWQSALLLLPFLNIARAASALRISRFGRVVSASLRGTRSTRHRLTGRLGWAVTVTVGVVLITTDVLYEFADLRPYGKALHDVAVATMTGEPIPGSSGIIQTVEVFLALYSVVFFASFAGALGAYFLERDRERDGAG